MFQNFANFLKQPLNSSPADIFLIVGVVGLSIVLWHLTMRTIGEVERAVAS